MKTKDEIKSVSSITKIKTENTLSTLGKMDNTKVIKIDRVLHQELSAFAAKSGIPMSTISNILIQKFLNNPDLSNLFKEKE